jgi:hypothetical protein
LLVDRRCRTLKEELDEIKKSLDLAKPFMTPEGLKEVESTGMYVRSGIWLGNLR